MPPDIELMELDILEDIPVLLGVPQEVMSNFDVWVHDVLSYSFDSVATIYIYRQYSGHYPKSAL